MKKKSWEVEGQVRGRVVVEVNASCPQSPKVLGNAAQQSLLNNMGKCLARDL